MHLVNYHIGLSKYLGQCHYAYYTAAFTHTAYYYATNTLVSTTTYYSSAQFWDALYSIRMLT
jgi:hypothetical protein